MSDKKQKEPMKQVRVPAHGAKVAKNVVTYFLSAARKKLEQTEWWQTIPSQDMRDRIVLELVGIKIMTGQDVCGGYPYLFVVARALDPVIEESVELYIQLSEGVVENEDVADILILS